VRKTIDVEKTVLASIQILLSLPLLSLTWGGVLKSGLSLIRLVILPGIIPKHAHGRIPKSFHPRLGLPGGSARDQRRGFLDLTNPDAAKASSD